MRAVKTRRPIAQNSPSMLSTANSRVENLKDTARFLRKRKKKTLGSKKKRRINGPITDTLKDFVTLSIYLADTSVY